ncbi:DUF4188 domain-containing protein [Terriglobus sp. 2YAB30_2]|uniref:DUF4188 domain-containing protein n=1 Tax=unclassified Terriglobus TaxID=2628988 RepID=UPI003F9DA66A
MSVQTGRYTAQLEGDFVVFLIGMRINSLLAIHKWMPVTKTMPRMLKELYHQPELGFLRHEIFLGRRTLMTVQYWRTFDQLHAYAHARNHEHLPAWAEFNRRVVKSGVVGVFHETYLVKAGQYEAIYSDMPRFGLASAGQHVPAIGRLNTARERLQQD